MDSTSNAAQIQSYGILMIKRMFINFMGKYEKSLSELIKTKQQQKISKCIHIAIYRACTNVSKSKVGNKFREIGLIK